jgi:predicted permease
MSALRQVIARLRAGLRVLWRSRELDRDMHDEMRFHLDMEAERLARDAGLHAPEAHRQAHVRFGGVERYKEAGRDARGRRWLDALLMDLRLGARMLIKYRGMSFVGGLAMTMAIGIGATAFEVLGELLTPALPFDEGDRVVSIRYVPPDPADDERQLLADVDTWRRGLTTVGDLGVSRDVSRNLAAPPALAEPIRLAEMSASGFTLARTQPLLGRYLVSSDEASAAPPVVVIGYRAWQSRFAGRPDIVGQVLRLDGTAHTVVGVMPEGFGFPVDHQYWLPFRAEPRIDARGRRQQISIFGRLVRGASIEQAQAELATLERRPLADRGVGTANATRLTAVPYTLDHVDLADPGVGMLVRMAQLFTGALTVVVAINVGILFYARTVTRSGELAVRTALGASRARLLTQLFIEALALALVGAVAGLLASGVTLAYLQRTVQGIAGVPYWIHFDVSVATILNALALAAVAALIMGVLPGLKTTGRRISAKLNDLSGRSSARLGPVWTTLVIVQVASAVAVLPAAVYLTWQTLQMEIGGRGFADDKFVVSFVALPNADRAGGAALLATRLRALTSRVQGEPGVAAVTLSSSVPGLASGASIEFDRQTPTTTPAPWHVSRLDVAVDLFDVYGAELLAGRWFTAGETGTASGVVVNETFARWIAGAGSALGARFRYLRRAGLPADASTYEVVGVVRDFPRVPAALNLDTPAVVFHAAEVGTFHPAVVSIRFHDAPPADFSNRLRLLAAEVDPALLIQARPLAEYYDRIYSVWRYVSFAASLATLSVILLSAAGMYALMSFTVSQRTREIGIRIALGARPRSLFFNVFGRALRQLALGIAAGSLISGLTVSAIDLEPAAATAILTGVATLMLVAGLLAAVGPARRSLAIHPSETLRADG